MNNGISDSIYVFVVFVAKFWFFDFAKNKGRLENIYLYNNKKKNF